MWVWWWGLILGMVLWILVVVVAVIDFGCEFLGFWLRWWLSLGVGLCILVVKINTMEPAPRASMAASFTAQTKEK